MCYGDQSISDKLAFEVMETAICNMLCVPISEKRMKEKDEIIKRYLEEIEREEMENDTIV